MHYVSIDSSIQLSKPKYAAWFPHSLKYFTPATSLGGVESLVEYRYSWDPSGDPNAVRISIGVEDLDDLKADIGQALKHLVNVCSSTIQLNSTDISSPGRVQALRKGTHIMYFAPDAD